MIKAIFFDLDDTIFDSTGITRKARWESCSAMIREGLPAKSTKEAVSVLNKIIKEHGSNYSLHFNRLCEHYSLKPDPKIVAAGIIAYHDYKVGALNPFPHVRGTLLDLLKKGYKLGLITNGIPIKQWDKIIRLKIREFFEVILVSDSEKQDMSKVNMIKKAMRNLRLKKGEVIFIGDRPEPDISSANAVGVWSVRILKGKYSKAKISKSSAKPDFKMKEMDEIMTILDQVKKIKKKDRLQKTLV